MHISLPNPDIFKLNLNVTHFEKDEKLKQIENLEFRS
jgi:hypothetical protein